MDESAHERIFIQYWMDEATWCSDRIDGDAFCEDEKDVEYIRLDLHEAAIAERDKEIERMSTSLANAHHSNRSLRDQIRDDDTMWTEKVSGLQKRAEKAERELAVARKEERSDGR